MDMGARALYPKFADEDQGWLERAIAAKRRLNGAPGTAQPTGLASTALGPLKAPDETNPRTGGALMANQTGSLTPAGVRSMLWGGTGQPQFVPSRSREDILKAYNQAPPAPPAPLATVAGVSLAAPPSGDAQRAAMYRNDRVGIDQSIARMDRVLGGQAPQERADPIAARALDNQNSVIAARKAEEDRLAKIYTDGVQETVNRTAEAKRATPGVNINTSLSDLRRPVSAAVAARAGLGGGNSPLGQSSTLGDVISARQAARDAMLAPRRELILADRRGIPEPHVNQYLAERHALAPGGAGPLAVLSPNAYADLETEKIRAPIAEKIASNQQQAMMSAAKANERAQTAGALDTYMKTNPGKTPEHYAEVARMYGLTLQPNATPPTNPAPDAKTPTPLTVPSPPAPATVTLPPATDPTAWSLTPPRLKGMTTPVGLNPADQALPAYTAPTRSNTDFSTDHPDLTAATSVEDYFARAAKRWPTLTDSEVAALTAKAEHRYGSAAVESARKRGANRVISKLVPWDWYGSDEPLNRDNAIRRLYGSQPLSKEEREALFQKQNQPNFTLAF